MHKDADARAVSLGGLLGLGGGVVGLAIALPIGFATGDILKWLLLILPIGVGVGLTIGALVAVCWMSGSGWCRGCGRSVPEPDAKCPNCDDRLSAGESDDG